MGIKLFSRKRTAESSTPKGNAGQGSAGRRVPRRSAELEGFVPAIRQPVEQDPLKRLFVQQRLCKLIADRAKFADHPEIDVYVEQANRALEQRFALVPAGSVTFCKTLTAHGNEEDTDVKPFLLGINAVTNDQYQQFVDADGYDDLDFWPEDIWPHLIEFKDQTDRPGPRFWQDGRHDARLTDHPVVGVSWYEACAFARWAGLRIPTESEWQMACSWHINSSADLLRRFPWGDAMDNMRCNIWSSRIGTTAPVTDYSNGAAPNHVLQLVGNVWEWLSTEFEMFDDEGRQIIAEMPMKGIRGGAFDTYFETQLTSEFRTGQITLARVHNVGFRCAMDLDAAGWLDGD